MSVENKVDLGIYKVWNDAITKSKNIEQMGNQLTQLIVGGLAIKGASLFILNTDKKEFQVLSTAGLSVRYVNKGPIIKGKSIRPKSNRKPVIISDIEKNDQLQYPEDARREGIRAIVSLPVKCRGKIIGSLRLYHAEPWDVSDGDLIFLNLLTRNIGLAFMYYRVAHSIGYMKEIVQDIHPIWL